jgi:O-antigen/teichoic acid export membrane protein
VNGVAEDYASTAQPVDPNRWLWSAFARSVRDNMMAEFVVQALRIGGMVILARALAPHDFGLLKILVVVATFATLANEGGIPDALIQRKDLTPEHQWTAWWMSIGLAFLTVCILYIGAPGLARAMKIPELREGTRLLCIPFLLEGAAVTANAQLRRELRFGALAAADVLGELAFVLVALFLLWHGMPQWSLAGGLSARYAAHALSLLTVAGKVPRGLPRVEAARDLGTFAGKVFGGRVVDAFSSNVDFLLIGRLLGSSALGFYAMAWDLLRFVPDRVYKIAGRVTFPAFCALRDQEDQLARAYLNFCGYLSRLVLPIVLCAAIAAPELLRAIYGPKWVPAAVPMQLLACGLLLVGLRLAIGSVYYAKNHPEFDFYIHSTRLVLVVITVCGLASTGLVGVCMGRSAVEVTISIVGQWLACILIGVSFGDLVTALLPGFRLALICGVAVGAGKLLAIHLGIVGPLNLIIIAVPPALAYMWLESASAMKLVADAFGRGRLTPSATAGEA